MMVLKEVKDWLKTSVQANVWKIGAYDSTNNKTICVRNLTSNRSQLAIGGLNNTTTAVKGVSIVLHWNKDPDESERVSQQVHALFYGQSPVIGQYRIVKCDMRSDEPISLGIDDNGIYEYAIETWLTYDRERKDI